MKHASKQILNRIEDILKQIRKISNLKEKQRGIFYKKNIAYLHFHEDPKGIFADLKVNNKWKRFKINTKQEQNNFLKKLKQLKD